MAYECSTCSSLLSFEENKDNFGFAALSFSPSICYLLHSIISKYSLNVASISLTSQKPLFCSDCHINKSHKMPFHQTSITSQRPLQYVFSDFWLSPILSTDNNKYYVIVVDHYNRYIPGCIPYKRNHNLKKCSWRLNHCRESFQVKIGLLYSDNGVEYKH